MFSIIEKQLNFAICSIHVTIIDDIGMSDYDEKRD